MKRTEIKIAEPGSSVVTAASTATAVVVPSAAAAAAAASSPAAPAAATTIFPAGRQPAAGAPAGAPPPAAAIITTEILPPHSQPAPAAAAAAAASTFTRVIAPGAATAVPVTGAAGVSVYRDSAAVAITPAATTSATLHSSPAATTTVVTQPPNFKPEPIALPTAPVSVQYTSSFPPGSVKTLQQTSVASTNAAQTIVQSLQGPNSAAHGQQIVQAKAGHQAVSYTLGAAPAVRPLSSGATLPTIPNPQVVQAKLEPGAPVPATTTAAAAAAAAAAATASSAGGNAQYRNLKVEDALSYLDQVKYKFGNQPEIYNDFLDIMKEFKSQSIDTPGVIARVSCLFKGHPELIVGFNTFLPPGYKIEVQCNDSTSRTQNVPGIIHGGAPGSMQTIVHTPQGVHTMGMHGNMTAIQPATVSVTPSLTAPNSIRALAAHGTTTTVAASTTLQPAQQLVAQPAAATVTTKFVPKAPETAIRPANLLPQQPAVAAATAQIATSAPYTGNPLTIHPATVHAAPPAAAVANAAAAAAVTANPATVHLRDHQPTHGGINNSSQPLPAAAAANVPAAAVASVTPSAVGAANNQQQQQQQPVEFNHAITYVNKIKNRFSGQPEVYKSFLEILHSYQKDQKAIKEGHPQGAEHLTEAEVYGKVSKLFRNQEDLLSEFGQFLPEAGEHAASAGQGGLKAGKKPAVGGAGANYRFPSADLPGSVGGGAGGHNKFGSSGGLPSSAPAHGPGGLVGSNKRPPSGITHPPPKKMKPSNLRDVSLAEAGKWGTLNEYAFFDKVRKALRSNDVYENFLRILVLFNQEIVSREELVQLSSSFLGKHPELFKWFKDFVGYKEGGARASQPQLDSGVIPSAAPAPGRERMSGDSAQEIDYATCKRLGASYCALPKTFVQPKCAGRTQLCKEVLNDMWVSFPSWSEDSQFVTSRKTQYEEFIYRTEDERFEFDVVLETNKDTIKALEGVQKKMTRMPPEEAARYRLDDGLGGTSHTIHQRAIRRIYGDKAGDIIDGLKRNPVVAVPLVLKRLRAKDEEWREVQKNFNKVWREQNEKFYLKSLDHQGMPFKQTDSRNLRSKAILQDIENLYDDRHEMDEASHGRGGALQGPHVTLDYHDPHILIDANNLLIHHVKRQTGIHKEDKHKIKVLLRHWLLDCFKHHRQDLSDDERENDDEDEDDGANEESSDKEASSSANNGKATRAERARKKKENERKEKEAKQSNLKKGEKEVTEADVKQEVSRGGRRTPLHAREMDADESYTHLLGNNHWYLFFKLHNILCERLDKIYTQATLIAAEEARDKTNRKESTAIALRLKPKSDVSPENYYPAFIDMVKNLLDGNMDSNAYEDTLREMFGIHAYVSYTLDKVVINAVRQLQNLVTDEAASDCYELFQAESKRGATGGTCGTAHERLVQELVYQKRAEKLMDDENCFKIVIYHQSKKVTVELLDSEAEGHHSEQEPDGAGGRDAEANSKQFHSYVDSFVQPGDAVSAECKAHLAKKPVFLPRGIRSYSKSSFAKKLAKERQQQKEKEAKAKEEDGANHVEADAAKAKAKNNKKANSEDGKTDQDGAQSKTSSDVEMKDGSLSRLPSAENGVINEDNTQCQFKPGSMKMLYVIPSENCFYRKGALARAKESHKKVSQRKHGDFSRWHSAWAGEHVAEGAGAKVQDWFMGNIDGLVDNKTTRVVRNDPDRAPYRTLNKYKAQIL